MVKHCFHPLLFLPNFIVPLNGNWSATWARGTVGWSCEVRVNAHVEHTHTHYRLECHHVQYTHTRYRFECHHVEYTRTIPLPPVKSILALMV